MSNSEVLGIADTITQMSDASKALTLFGLAGAGMLWWQSQKVKAIQNAVQEVDNATAKGIESIITPTNTNRHTLDRRTSSKLVRGVQFPVSRHNPPRIDTRADGI
jgi:hypothetical protein